MGMFDEVTIQCPSCGELHIEQTKAGPCTLGVYPIESAPMSIMDCMVDRSEEGRLSCEHCGTQIKIEVVSKPVVKVSVKESDW